MAIYLNWKPSTDTQCTSLCKTETKRPQQQDSGELRKAKFYANML